MAANFCTGCGAPLASGAQFCSNCGLPLSAPAERPKPRRKLLYWALGIIAVLGIIGSLAPDEEPEPIATVTSPVDACNQFWAISKRTVIEQRSDDESGPEYRALAKATGSVDVVLATGIQDMTEQGTTADVSDRVLVVMRRCVSLGWPPPTEAEMRAFLEAASKPVPR